MLPPIKIGNIIISNPVILAPQAGITDNVFRNLVSSFGDDRLRASLTVSEMVPSQSQVIMSTREGKSEKLKKLYTPYNSEQLVSVQIFGSDPDFMGQSAIINQTLGADIIDINMGCPMPKITKNLGGSYLMKDISLAEKIIKQVVKSVEIPVSVKFRTGWDNNTKNCTEFAKMCEACGASFITIHGRTRTQLYSGYANLDDITSVKKVVKIPVIGNGDITTPEIAREMILKTGVDGVMVGRGIYGQPWLIYHINYFLKTGIKLPFPSILEIKQILITHLNKMIDTYGETVGILNSRKHIAWYSKGLKNSSQFRNLVNNLKSKQELFNLIEEMFK